jgi:hypothetical protein
MSNDIYDFGVRVVEKDDAADNLRNVFFGITADGELHASNTVMSEFGAYVQIAYIEDLGNTMYYAIPIARAFVVMPETVDIIFVGADDENSYKVQYDGEPQKVEVIVKDKNGVQLDDEFLSVVYVGLSAKGEKYHSEVAPIDAGVYTVIVTYYNEEKGLIGANAAVLIIEAANSDFILNDTTIEYDGLPHFVDMSNPNELKHLDIIVSGNKINFIVKDYADVDKVEMTSDEVIKYVLDMVKAVVDFEYESLPEELKNMLDDVSGYEISINGELPVEIGVYDVYAIATGDNHKITLSKAVLTIKEKEKVEEPVVPEEPENPKDPVDPEEPGDGGKDDDKPNDGPHKDEILQTGDGTRLPLIVLLMVGSLMMMLFAIYKKHKIK